MFIRGMDIPEDADGDAMRRVLASGSDPTLPMKVDFMIACPDVIAAGRIAELVDEMGYATAIKVYDEDRSVTCYCTKDMMLLYEDLISSQEDLDAVARQHDGFIDGWGTFGNVSSQP